MAYATKADIETKYGDQITTMIVDHGRDLIELAEDDLNDAIANNQPQSIIDDLTLALTDAQANLQTNADETIDRNLTDAQGFIDGYIKARYPRDWVTLPPLLRSLNVDIAVYYMSLSADWRTDEMKERHKQAVKSLEEIRDGLIDLIGEMVASEEETTVTYTGGIGIGNWVRS